MSMSINETLSINAVSEIFLIQNDVCFFVVFADAIQIADMSGN